MEIENSSDKYSELNNTPLNPPLDPPFLIKSESVSEGLEKYPPGNLHSADGASASSGGPVFSKNRERSSLRFSYEAQSAVIRRQIGELDAIREKLGLSQRKMCQLLMVDPSAWTRWTHKDSKGAPPHIYRMLEWYLALNEKLPQIHTLYYQTPQFVQSLKNRSDGEFRKNVEELKTLKTEAHFSQNQAFLEIARLQRMMTRDRRRFFWISILAAGLSLASLLLRFKH